MSKIDSSYTTLAATFIIKQSLSFYDTVKLRIVEKNIGCAATFGNVTAQPICNIIEKSENLNRGHVAAWILFEIPHYTVESHGRTIDMVV